MWLASVYTAWALCRELFADKSVSVHKVFWMC